VQKRLKAISTEIAQLRQRELFKLKQQVDVARAEGRKLLKELAERLDAEIARAREELRHSSKSGEQ